MKECALLFTRRPFRDKPQFVKCGLCPLCTEADIKTIANLLLSRLVYTFKRVTHHM